MAYKFTENAVNKIVAAVNSVTNTSVDGAGARSLKRSYDDRYFWARIDCYCPLSTNRWKYSWVEMQRDTGDQWEIKDNGRYGDCCDGATTYAINSVEFNNTSTGIQGNSANDQLAPPYDPYATRFMVPVRGSPIVLMKIDFPSTGDQTAVKKPVYSFAYKNEESDTAWENTPNANTCCPTPNASGSGSSAFNCVFAYSSYYNCVTASWTPPIKDGTNCQPTGGIVFNTWQQPNPNAKVAYYFIKGPSCPGPEQTHACGPFPAAPTTLPTATPPCGSSGSSGSGSSSLFVCMFAFVSTYNCVTKAWGPPVTTGVNCQPIGSVTPGVWIQPNPNSTISYYYIAGAPCPGPEETHACGAYPAPPTSLPTATPLCPSSGSHSGSSGSASSYSYASLGSGTPSGYCLYNYTASYSCSTSSWAISQSATTCGNPPGAAGGANQWAPTDATGNNFKFVVVGAPCAGTNNCPLVGPYTPDPPNVSPNCGSSSGSSRGSGSSGGSSTGSGGSSTGSSGSGGSGGSGGSTGGGCPTLTTSTNGCIQVITLSTPGCPDQTVTINTCGSSSSTGGSTGNMSLFRAVAKPRFVAGRTK